MTDPYRAVCAALDELREEAGNARGMARDPLESPRMQQAHLHRAAALTKAWRKIRDALTQDQQCGGA